MRHCFFSMFKMFENFLQYRCVMGIDVGEVIFLCEMLKRLAILFYRYALLSLGLYLEIEFLTVSFGVQVSIKYDQGC